MRLETALSKADDASEAFFELQTRRRSPSRCPVSRLSP